MGTLHRVLSVGLLLAGLMWGGATDAQTPRKDSAPVPEQRITLDTLGFAGTPALGLLRTQASIATLDFVDGGHVLLTFATRPLQQRNGQDDAPTPAAEGRPREERVVHAEIVDLATGKISDAQDWRLYDRDWYLLPLGNAEFLLRRGSRLTLLDAHAFQFNARPFADAPQAVVWGQTSAGVLLVELEHEAHTPEQHAQMEHDARLFDAHPPVEQALALGWKLPPSSADQPVLHLLLAHAERLAATPQGLLGMDGDDGKFELYFLPYGHQEKDRRILRKLRSDCRPQVWALRQDMALMTLCKGGQTQFAGIQIDEKAGKPLWQHAAGLGALPEVRLAEDGRRFAAQSVGAAPASSDGEPPESEFQRGNIQVFDVDTGARVFATVLEPLYAPSHTVALSPDGRRVAMLRKGALEIYDLPPLPVAADKSK